MTQEQGNALIRMILTLLGAFLAGGGIKLFGITIDTAYWQEIVGFVLAGYSIYWGIKSKNVAIEQWQSLARQVVIFGGGILVARGVITTDKLGAIVAFVVALIPLLQSYLTKKKSDQLEQGKIQVAQLKKSK